MGTDSAATRVLAALWLAMLLQCVALYFAFAEPYDGTWRMYTMRLMSPVVVVLLAMSFVHQRRTRHR